MAAPLPINPGPPPRAHTLIPYGRPPMAPLPVGARRPNDYTTGQLIGVAPGTAPVRHTTRFQRYEELFLLRDPIFRKPNKTAYPGGKIDANDVATGACRYEEAWIGQMVGYPSPEGECTACERGLGPFTRCMVVPRRPFDANEAASRADSACANCIYGDKSARCNIRTLWDALPRNGRAESNWHRRNLVAYVREVIHVAHANGVHAAQVAAADPDDPDPPDSDGDSDDPPDPPDSADDDSDDNPDEDRLFDSDDNDSGDDSGDEPPPIKPRAPRGQGKKGKGKGTATASSSSKKAPAEVAYGGELYRLGRKGSGVVKRKNGLPSQFEYMNRTYRRGLLTAPGKVVFISHESMLRGLPQLVDE